MESVKKRQEEATSRETLEDLENSEAPVDNDDETDAPSPDGDFDDDDEMNNAEPI